MSTRVQIVDRLNRLRDDAAALRVVIDAVGEDGFSYSWNAMHSFSRIADRMADELAEIAGEISGDAGAPDDDAQLARDLARRLEAEEAADALDRVVLEIETGETP